MSYRKNFILDVCNKNINPEDPKITWVSIEQKYNYEPTEGSKPGDRARKHFLWWKKVGALIGEWAPGQKIEDQDISDEMDQEDTSELYLKPTESIVDSRLWQEFLAFKDSKNEQRDFLPGTYILMGCIHVPFHNAAFVGAALNLIRDIKPDGLLLCGDYLDMNSLSSHDIGKKPLDGVTLSWEYDEGNRVLDLFDNAHDYKIKHYIYGNHEDRFWRNAQKVDIAKLGDALINPTVALSLRERGYQVQEKWKEAVVYLGKHLEVIHGDSVAQFSTKKHMDAFRTSMAYFHTHRFQVYMEGNTSAWNLGWGGDITSKAFDYATKTMKASWKNGFGVVTIDELGGYHIEPIIWHNDRFYYGKQKYS